MTKLNTAYKVHTLAADLNLKPSADPVKAILTFCEDRVRRVLKDFPKCSRPAELLDILAAKLQTRFEIIKNNEDLVEIKQRYMRAGEKRFVTLENEFPTDVYGITFRRLSKQPWEPAYVSVIDVRGEKLFRANHTKWHELGHLLVLTDQLRISFSRTFCTQDLKDPEESLVDVIAGHCAFWPSFFSQHVTGRINFERIEKIRLEVCPETSRQSALLGFVKIWQEPSLFLVARLGMKKQDQRMASQQRFAFREQAKPMLRVSSITFNESAANNRLRVHYNWRVPEKSVIWSVFNAGGRAIAEENLAYWRTSSGTSLDDRTVHVEARSTGDSVQALITLG